jgi:hypothetical protein
MSSDDPSGEGARPEMKMPAVVICQKCGRPIEDLAAAVEMTPMGTDTRQFAHKPIPGCPTD